MFSKFFIHRPVFACVVSIIIVLLGLVAYPGLPVAQYPELAPPVVRVEASYPGADAKTVADTVASAIEQEVNGVDRMIYMSSTSSGGQYSLDVSFETATNVDMAAVLVQNRVKLAEPKLPEDVRRLGVSVKKQSTSMVGVIALYSDTGASDDITLANFITLYWKDEFSRIPGVGAINIIPAKEYGMRIWLDPEKLKVRGLTVADVNAALNAQNVQVAAGAIGRQPAPAGTDFELVITTKGRLANPAEFEDIIVKSEQRAVVRLRDVARVELGARDYATLATFNGKPNAIMIVYQLPGANLVDVADNVTKTLAKLTDARFGVPLPPGAKAKFFYDSSMFIKSSLHEVFKTLIEAFVLVFLVVFVFLQSLRTTLIPAVTIPVSLIGTLVVMKALGFSINTLTMFGMVLAIGIVVDDAIVVVENVERNLREHNLSPVDATIKAMSEISGPVIAITLVLMSVFLPTAALPGITGEMYRQFALTIAASTFLSAINALTLSPALCAIILTAHSHAQKKSPLLAPLRFAASLFNRAFDALTRAYGAVCRLSIRAWIVSFLVFAGVLAGTSWLAARVPTGFVPEEDLGFVVIAAQLPDGASLERSKTVIDRVRSEVAPLDGVDNVVTLAGFSVIQGTGSSYANAWVPLKPWDERVKSNRGARVIMAEISARLRSIQEAQFLVFSLPSIPGIGNSSGFDLRLQDKVGIGRQAMQGVTDEVIGTAMGQPGILAAFTGYRAGVPQLYLDIDREKAIKMGVPLQAVFDALQTHLGSKYINDFNLLGRTFQVNVQADSQFRLRTSDILKLEVRSTTGQMVPLGTLINVRDAIGPDRIERYNMYPAATINGIPRPGTSSGEAISIMEQLAAEKLPPGVGYEWTALSYQEKRTGSTGMIVFGLGIVLVYLILAAQYESWTTPIAVVLAVPLVITGAMVALKLTGMDNNVFTQIGLVLLIGLGAKNAILIVEFARENEAKGARPFDAAVAAATQRFRPILMTSLAFILGVVPLMTATGAGAASRRSLGTAVFGGMTGATILGLLFTPVIYVMVRRIVLAVTPRPAENYRASH